MHAVPSRSIVAFKCANNCIHPPPKPAEDVAYCSKCEYGVCRRCIGTPVRGGSALRAGGLVMVVFKTRMKRV